MMSFLGVPIRYKGKSLGNLYLTNKRGAAEFSEQDQHLIEQLAAHAAIAIDNARLYEKVQQLRVLEERQGIGMDLHDGTIQSIYGVGLSLEGTLHALDEDTDDARKRLRVAMDGLNQVIRDIRSYILDLRPRKMGEDGLVGGVKRLVAEFRANLAAEVKLSGVDADYSGLPDTHSTVLFHMSGGAGQCCQAFTRQKSADLALGFG